MRSRVVCVLSEVSLYRRPQRDREIRKCQFNIKEHCLLCHVFATVMRSHNADSGSEATVYILKKKSQHCCVESNWTVASPRHLDDSHEQLCFCFVLF